MNTQRTCYGWDGQPNTDSPLCQPNATISNCCHAGDVCYSGGFCHKPDSAPSNNGIWFVGLCTSIFFDGPECAAELACHQRNVTGNGLLQCSDDTFCCYGSTGCDCNNEAEVFTLPTGTIITSLPVATAMSTAATTTLPSSTSITSTAASMTNPPSMSSTPSSSPTAQQSSDSSSSNHSTAIGVGVGVSLGALVLVTVALIIWLGRRKSHAATRKASTVMSDTTALSDQESGTAVGAPISSKSRDSSIKEADSAVEARELGADHERYELASETAPQELQLSPLRTQMPPGLRHMDSRGGPRRPGR